MTHQDLFLKSVQDLTKRKRHIKLVIHEDKVIKPDGPIPPGSRFKVYRNFVVQDLKI